MSKNEYPKWKYAAEGKSRIVHNADEESALEGEWHDSPAQTADATPEPEARSASAADNEGERKPMDVLGPDEVGVLRKRLEAQADTIGLKVQKSWTNEKLQRMIFEAGSS